MQFINIVVHSVEDMNFRVHLQYEFTKLGLDDYLEVRAARSRLLPAVLKCPPSVIWNNFHLTHTQKKRTENAKQTSVGLHLWLKAFWRIQ